MKKIPQDSSGDNSEPQALEPYVEMIVRQLISAIKHLMELLRKGEGNYFDLPLPDNNYKFSKSWAAGSRLPLDHFGRAFLRHLGICQADLRLAINEGIRTSKLERITANGVSYVGLKEVQR